MCMSYSNTSIYKHQESLQQYSIILYQRGAVMSFNIIKYIIQGCKTDINVFSRNNMTWSITE